MRLVSLVLLFLMTAPASATNFWIPAESFDKHTDRGMEGALVVDDYTGKQVQLLGNDQQVRIMIRLDNGLRQYLDNNAAFQVCASVANYDSGLVNTVLSKHFNFDSTRQHNVNSTEYKLLCSEQSSIENGHLNFGGLKVISPSQGTVKVRGVLLRNVADSATQSTLYDYEFSRALGYLWGDGKASADGNFLTFPRKNTPVSKHFGSVAKSAFGNSLITNSSGLRYFLRLNGKRPAKFLADGKRLSEIPDKEAFLTSVIETEGAVLVGRVADDPSITRCAFIKAVVDDINPRCAANTCTDASCSTANCAFIASGKKRGIPHSPGKFCAVYLSGDANDWRRLFRGDDYHFVKTDRTPGGEPTKNSPDSRPSYR